jgi:RNA polymerase sigma-70 factor (ECF subfamily)
VRQDVQASLIRRARDGSDAALNDLFSFYGEKLLGLVRLRLGPGLRPRIESQDILQETLLKAFRGIDQFDGSGERTLIAWLGTIARNVIRDEVGYLHRKARDVDREVPLTDAAKPIELRIRDEASRLELSRKSLYLERALEELEPDRREVIVLRHFEELTYPEIAERTGKAPDACRMMHRRTMASLAIRMRELGLEESGRG